jgi:hypothetical protein
LRTKPNEPHCSIGGPTAFAAIMALNMRAKRSAAAVSSG